MDAAVIDDLYDEVLARTGIEPDVPLSREAAEAAMDLYLEAAEAVISETCGRYGRRFLLLALQSQVPTAILDPRRGFEADQQELFNLAAVAVFKHGLPDSEAEVGLSHESYEHELVANHDISCFSAYSGEISRLWGIVHLFDSAMARARCVGKGAEIAFPSRPQIGTTSPGPVAKMDEATTKMVSLYDERIIRNLHLLPTAGYPAPLVDDAPIEVPMACIDFDAYRRGAWPAPARIGAVSMYSLYFATRMRNRQVIEQFNRRLHTEELFCFHSGILAPVLENLNHGSPPLGVGGCYIVARSELVGALSTRGPYLYSDLVRFNRRVLPAQEAVEVVFESFRPDYWAEIIEPLIAEFSYSADEVEGIDLRIVGHGPTSYLFELEEDFLFMHLGLVQWTMQTLWSRFEAAGDEANLRGETFEKELAACLRNDDYSVLWPLRKSLPARVGGSRETDADVLIGRDNAAFLIECKSYKRTDREHRGEQNACWGRWEDVRGWLRHTEELAEWIAENATDCDLPEHIDFIVPVVCSGVPEYIWEPNERFFLPGEQPATARTSAYPQPRVATIEELEAYLHSLHEEDMELLRGAEGTVTVSRE